MLERPDDDASEAAATEGPVEDVTNLDAGGASHQTADGDVPTLTTQ